MRILSPAGAAELMLMLDWALERAAEPGGPIAIRYPKGEAPVEETALSQPLVEGRGVWVSGPAKGPEDPEDRICLAFTGGLYAEARRAADILANRGLRADCYNLRFLKPVDEDYLASIMDRYGLTVFVEEGIREGGFGEYALALARRRNCGGRVLALAVEGDFEGLGTRRELLKANRLDGEGIADYALSGVPLNCGAKRIG
jgi:1-deoxy-D-xylulose-5-phosphate synthase